MARKNLSQLIQETYPDDVELQKAALREVQTAGTEKDIVRGKLVLPHPVELRRHMARVAEQARQQKEDGD